MPHCLCIARRTGTRSPTATASALLRPMPCGVTLLVVLVSEPASDVAYWPPAEVAGGDFCGGSPGSGATRRVRQRVIAATRTSQG
jgi:hypothetical protein